MDAALAIGAVLGLALANTQMSSKREEVVVEVEGASNQLNRKRYTNGMARVRGRSSQIKSWRQVDNPVNLATEKFEVTLIDGSTFFIYGRPAMNAWATC